MKDESCVLHGLDIQRYNLHLQLLIVYPHFGTMQWPGDVTKSFDYSGDTAPERRTGLPAGDKILENNREKELVKILTMNISWTMK